MSSEQRVEYPVSAGYVEKWGAVEMLREVVANAVDSKSKVCVSFVRKGRSRRGTAYIVDHGSGFGPSFLMIGNGADKDGGQIGQFKEGLKLAMLVAAREKRSFKLFTTGFAISKVAMEMTQLGGEGLTVYMDPTRQEEVGTAVALECTQDEYDAAAMLFLAIEFAGNTVKKLDIPDGQKIWKRRSGTQEVYVNGQLVQKKTNYVFSYNLIGEHFKQNQNRDRSILDHYEISEALAQQIGELEDPEMIEMTIKALLVSRSYSDLSSFSVSFVPAPNRHLWRTAFLKFTYPGERVDGDKVLIGKGLGAEEELTLKDMGYKVIRGLTSYQVRYMCDMLFESAENVLKKQGKDPIHIVDDEEKVLTGEQLRNLKQLKHIARETVTAMYPARKLPPMGVFSYHKTNNFVDGLWWKGKIWLKQSKLSGSQSQVDLLDRVTILLHEMAHWLSGGAEDRSRTFEFAQSNLAARMAICVSGIGVSKPTDEVADLLDLPVVPWADIKRAAGFREGEKEALGHDGRVREVTLNSAFKKWGPRLEWRLVCHLQMNYKTMQFEPNPDQTVFWATTSRGHAKMLRVKLTKCQVRLAVYPLGPMEERGGKYVKFFPPEKHEDLAAASTSGG